MTWMLVVGTAWMALALAVAPLVGRSIRLAERKQQPDNPVSVPDYVPVDWTQPQTEPAVVAAQSQRRPRIGRERR